MLLSGVVGSTAYGLAGPDSDVDRLGVFAAPTVEFHGLHAPVGKAATVVSHDPGDATFHEAGKLAALCLGGNPTVTELLWLDSYETESDLGHELVGIRSAFLSARRARDAYFGYATSQLHRLLDTGLFQSKMRKRVEKHARHLLRLLDQGFEVYSTGRLTIRVADPYRYMEFGRRVADDPQYARAALEQAEERFDAARSPLPDRPDEAKVERWLHRVRRAHLPWQPALALDTAPQRYEPKPGTPKAILVDVDGTVALHSSVGRSPFDWSRVGEDVPNASVIDAVRAMAYAGYDVVFVSGRSEECRDATAAWLGEHVLLPHYWGGLFMRAAGDMRKDSIVKLELFDRHVRDQFDVAAVFDDRAQVVSAWRSIGLTVFQVAEGQF